MKSEFPMLSETEIEILDQYTNTDYLMINGLMSDNITKGEKLGKIGVSVPRNVDEFKEILSEITCIYGAIIKYNNSPQKNKISKFLYRGQVGNIDCKSFLSTSYDLKRAATFAKKGEDKIIYKIEAENVPYIDLTQEGENEILFTPCQIVEIGDFEMSEEEKLESGIDFDVKMKHIKLMPREYTKEDKEESIDDICSEYEQYKMNVKSLKSVSSNSMEYDILVKEITAYKQRVSNYLCTKFYEINKNSLQFDNSSLNKIDLHKTRQTVELESCKQELFENITLNDIYEVISEMERTIEPEEYSI